MKAKKQKAKSKKQKANPKTQNPKPKTPDQLSPEKAQSRKNFRWFIVISITEGSKSATP
jgi:hypothetical protein